MEPRKEDVEFLSNKYDRNSHKEFEKYNSLLVFARIRIICIATVFAGVLFYCFDYITARNGADQTYIKTLIILHTICIVGSLLYLYCYKKIINFQVDKRYKLVLTATVIYVFLYVFMGVLCSINSQRYSSNIFAYICLALVAAVGFTLKPVIMIVIFGINHIIFLSGLYLLNDFKMISVKQYNASILIGIAIIFSLFFYRSRINDFVIKMKLRESEENFKKLFYVNPFPVFITRNKDSKIIKASEQALKLMQISEEDLEKNHNLILQIKKDSRIDLIEEIKRKSSVYNRMVEYEINGRSMWVAANYELITYCGEECILTGLMDITEIRKVEEELSGYAFTDDLTGVLNRRMGIKKIEELIQKAESEYFEFVLCFLDMNDLKGVNDTYGHGQGDNYIKAFCSTVGEELREEDIFFRMGGDEFIIVFIAMSPAEVEKIWNRILDRFYQSSKNMIIPVSRAASHGLFHYMSGMDITVEEMIAKADKYMYKEKKLHKNTVL